MGGGITFYETNASGSAGGTDFLKDNFNDMSVPATNNTGFSSTITKNPFSQAFANDDAPKFEYKTLWVKDLVLLSDRSQWQNNKPTYQVIFHENFPGIYAYVSGNIRLRNSLNGVSVDLREGGDIFGLTTTGRRVHFFLNPSQSTSQTATVKVDGAANGVTLSYGDSAGPLTGYNDYYANVHATAAETRDIHDYQLVALLGQTLNVAGIGVFFENTQGVIDVYPGSTYVNKDKKTNTTGIGASLPVLSGRIGAAHTVYKNSSGQYALDTVERTPIQSVGVGTALQNTVTVTTGTGASFPIGTGVVMSFGSTYAVASVQNVSTDTLTVGPTLPYGVSGSIWKAWQGGPTFPISATLYTLASSIDFGSAFVPNSPNSFGQSSSVLFFSDPYNRYRVYGQSLNVASSDGYKGVQFSGINSFLQVEGNFVAAEAEWIAGNGVTSVIHATYTINACPAYSQQLGFTSSIRQTIFTDAAGGLNQFRMTAGGSMLNATLRKINFYEFAPSSGVTLGRLAQVNSYGTQVNRSGIGVTNISLGVHQRIYADQFYLTGAWAVGYTASAPGAVYALGSSTNSVFKMSYFGTDWCLSAAQSASAAILFNGGAISTTFGVMNSVATLGFHTVTVQNSASLMILGAFDFVRPRSEIKNLQTFLPRSELANIPSVYQQTDTPLAPKPGDIWAPDQQFGSVWVYLWNKWVLLQTAGISDDPQISQGSITIFGGLA